MFQLRQRELHKDEEIAFLQKQVRHTLSLSLTMFILSLTMFLPVTHYVLICHSPCIYSSSKLPEGWRMKHWTNRLFDRSRSRSFIVVVVS